MYWETGAQITPPFDGYIVEKFNKIEKYEEIPSLRFKEGLKKGLITEIGSDFDEIYFKKIEELKLRDVDTKGFKVVYTPLHGTHFLSRALKRFVSMIYYRARAETRILIFLLKFQTLKSLKQCRWL